jgi:hypothetical protein
MGYGIWGMGMSKKPWYLDCHSQEISSCSCKVVILKSNDQVSKPSTVNWDFLWDNDPVLGIIYRLIYINILETAEKHVV